MTLSREQLLTKLVDTYGYPKQGAPVIAAKLMTLQPQVREEFERWWRDGTLPTLSVEGYSADRLMQERHLTPIAAILTLDWLVREPKKALETIVRGADVVMAPAAERLEPGAPRPEPGAGAPQAPGVPRQQL